jgi:uncharacterized protein
MTLVNRPVAAQQQQRLQARLLREPDDARRDRLWASLAPSLMRSAAPTLASLVTLPAPDPADRDPCPISPPAHQRLGLYYEDLIAGLLTRAVGPDALYRNIQCIAQGITAGEFDFLYCTAQRWFHLETAVKYYLCCGDGSALNHYVGPGRRDRLDIKWQRLQHHQLTLATQDAGRETLARLGIEISATELLMPGYLFYRAGTTASQSTLHADISPDHLRGWWLPIGELERLHNGSQERYTLPPKLRWLSPARPAEALTLSWNALRAHLSRCTHPVLVAQVALQTFGTEHYWGETGRGFVVPDDWDQPP